MKHLFFTLLLATLCAATGYGQTMKALSYNTTNNQVVASLGTNSLTFTNNVLIASGALLKLGNGTSHIDETGFYANQFNSYFSFEEQRLRFGDLDVFQWDANGAVTFGNAATTRTNLGLPLAALTNTNTTNFRTAIGAIASGGEPNFQSITITDEGDSISLVANAKATMRNLAGSTNTNEPYSGTVEFQDFSDNTVSIVVSNGIILNVTGP
jgi:hypothetical protein